ncbi:DNA-binding NarL/FixJ family response regulator [Yoonia maritima]|uniref:DNA-binding NarL/FixJ family response regulator n=1 Tax=Yoonia maritima TaxID=1435347 RepID=A0A2T0VZK0_9RHOB|nr:response regulator transcription factor [Yoonia maritima]PRY77788.1 DNA-binding NarL/FixJ family response regulator [Yoonia maritima]
MNKFDNHNVSMLVSDEKAKRRVLITDRNPVLAEVLANELNLTGVLECTFVPHGVQIIDEITARRPDALIFDPADMELSKQSDILELGRNIRRANPTTRVLGYSFKTTNSMVRGMLDAGFCGCISKNANLRQLAIALAVILDGGIYFDDAFGAHLRPMLAETADDDGLSEREKEVLVGFARGLSAKQIAHDLKISNKTVDTYKARASQKVGLSDRAQLVGYVLEQGWMS